jgi:hypothetical protein
MRIVTDPRRPALCPATGKRRYLSRFHAEKAMRSFQHAHRGGLGHLNVFQCAYCAGWHTGRQREDEA